MAIKISEVENIAHLARIELDADAKTEAAQSIDSILTLIDQMQSINTDGVKPLAHAFESSQRLREDVVTEQNQRDELQQLAPNVSDGLFLVPKVIE